MIRYCLVMLMAAAGGLWAQDKPFRPEPGKFPPIAQAKSYRGELVFVDHINRRGSLRLHIDDHFQEGRLHDFAMLPYGMIYYRGAPAQLRDIPIGTVLYGRFYLPPDPKTSAVPLAKGTRPSEPAETHAILLEDGPSFCLREGKSWKLKQIEYKGKFGFLTATLARKDGGEGLGGEHRLTIDPSTRIWRGRERLGINDLIKEGVWPGDGTKALKDQPVQLSLAWHPRYLYQQFHVADIWLDDAAIKAAATRQMERHNRYIRYRWMPARVTAVKHGQFGHATVTATLFGGMDPRLYADFKPGISGQMAVAENTLRTYWQNHDGMEGKFEAVTKMKGEAPFGSSGIQVQFSMNLVLEGFRPGRLVRIRPQVWPKIKPPVEEQIRSLEDRWPSPDIFKK